MKMSNIRTNFTNMLEPEQREFFWKYAESRDNDFKVYSMITVKPKKASSKEPKLVLTPAQLALLKTLGLV